MIDLFLNLDKHLNDVVLQYGVWTYAILFLIIFCETGLVVTPFLPGDSLLFAAGVFAHPERGAFDLGLLMPLLILASFCGDNVNFWIGKKLGLRLFKNENSRFFKKKHLEKTRAYYEKHGTKTIILGRFVPIVRTFAPFVAGLDAMEYRKFLPASIIGAVTWVTVCTGAGYLFGRVPWVEQNFSLAILVVVFLSFTGVFVEFVRARAKARRQARNPQS